MPDGNDLQARNAAYAKAARPCDIVMKGGAASGFVYARALTVLAKTYRLQSIGGTSAGAGAAGVAAAAEYGRRMGGPAAEGYAGIEDIPRWAGEIVPETGWTRLKHLFGPDPETARIYEVLTSLFPMEPYWWLRAMRTLLGAYLWWAVGAAVLLATVLVGLLVGPWPDAAYMAVIRGIGVLVAALAGALLVAGAAALGFLRDFTTAMPKNDFGMCSAFSRGAKVPAEKMTDWLYNLYQRLAGKPFDQPLTFGDLANARDMGPDPSRSAGTGAGIKLNVMSINVTLGRPYRLPFRDDDETYWFSPDEFRRLFPEPVVKAMEDAARRSPDAARFASRGLLPFPDEPDLPIIVAVRMSYALPILFSAVPLYAIDGSRLPDRQVAGEHVPAGEPERCWFVDGALASNFPVHLFDSPLPRWPTFAINLRKFHPDWKTGRADAQHDAWLDADYVAPGNRGVLREWWTRVDHDAVPGEPHRFVPVEDSTRFKRFLGAALATMMNWADNQQLRLPGYRDRVANVSLADDEGGGHFDMPAAKIERLAGRGGVAAQKLVDHYTRGDDPGPGWNQHRWTRYISSIQLAARFVEQFERGFKWHHAGDLPYDKVLDEVQCVPDGCEPLTPGKIRVAIALTQGLIAEEMRLPEEASPDWPSHPAIVPEPQIRLMPDM
jgi:predicted acylesterase/phospholipase RssA